MPGFFRRSGSARGVFPDRPIDPNFSLFTNVDDCLTFCSVADGEITPGPQVCTPPDPYISEVEIEDFDQP